MTLEEAVKKYNDDDLIKRKSALWHSGLYSVKLYKIILEYDEMKTPDQRSGSYSFFGGDDWELVNIKRVSYKEDFHE